MARSDSLGSALCDDPVCEGALAAADSLYIQGEFSDAISLLEYCLDSEALTPGDEVPALVLIAKAHQRENREMQAKAVIGRILTIDAQYRVDPVQETPDFRFLFEQVRLEMGLPDLVAGDPRPEELEVSPETEIQPPSRPWRTWLVAGGGAVLAGTVAAVVLSGGNGGGSSPADRWPAPPGRPGN